MWSQVGLRKHHYEQSWWRWWNSSWAVSNPKRWCCESAALSMPANLENSAVATGLEKVSFHPNPKEGQCSNYRTIALISHASKVMLKILLARLQQYLNHELSDVQAGFIKSRRTRDQLPTSVGSMKKQETSRKKKKKEHLLMFYWLCQSDCVSHFSRVRLCATP